MRKPAPCVAASWPRCPTSAVSNCCRSAGAPSTVSAARRSRIVEIQHHRLREHIRRTEARRMVRIALDLDRPAHPVLDHDAAGVAVQDVGGRVVVGQRGNDVGRDSHRRNQHARRAAPIASADRPAIANAAAISLQHAATVPRRGQPFGEARETPAPRARRRRDRPPVAAGCATEGSSVAYRAIRQIAVCECDTASSTPPATACPPCDATRC